MAISIAPRKVVRDSFGRFVSRDANDNLQRIRCLNASEAWELYDKQAMKYLGMPAEEFERALKRGDFRARQEEPDVRRVMMIRSKKPAP